MAKLTLSEIQATAAQKELTVIDATNYKNLQSDITVQCAKGHTFVTSMSSLRKDSFRCPNCEQIQHSALRMDMQLPEKKPGDYRIIAFDQSSKVIGVSVFDNGKLVYVSIIHVTGELPVRLVKLYNHIYSYIIPEWKPDYIVYEDIQLQNDNVQTFKILSMVLGVCTIATTQRGVETTQVLNTQWQKEFNITGKDRNTQKANVMKRVKEYYNLDVTNDEADAILLGRYAVKHLEHNWVGGFGNWAK